MKKVITALALTALLGALTLSVSVLARNPGDASSSGYSPDEIRNMTRTFVFEKNGRTITVVGRKDTGTTTPAPVKEYDPSDREWVGDDETWERIKRVVRAAFQTECDANLPGNLGRTEEFKRDLAQYFSASSGELQQRQARMEADAQRDAPMGAVTKSGITKMDFKGISVEGGQATVIVDVWLRLQGKSITEDTPDAANQYTMTLELENDQWLIVKEDERIRIPGSYTP